MKSGPNCDDVAGQEERFFSIEGEKNYFENTEQLGAISADPVD